MSLSQVTVVPVPVLPAPVLMTRIRGLALGIVLLLVVELVASTPLQMAVDIVLLSPLQALQLAGSVHHDHAVEFRSTHKMIIKRFYTQNDNLNDIHRGSISGNRGSIINSVSQFSINRQNGIRASSLEVETDSDSVSRSVNSENVSSSESRSVNSENASSSESRSVNSENVLSSGSSSGSDSQSPEVNLQCRPRACQREGKRYGDWPTTEKSVVSSVATEQVNIMIQMNY
jgi:hypothetical protein